MTHKNTSVICSYKPTHKEEQLKKNEKKSCAICALTQIVRYKEK